MPLCLSIEGLAARRGDAPIFRDLSFRVAGAEVLVVTGANGSGKSTLLRIVAGLLRAEAGRVRITGLDEAGDAHADDPQRRREACHYLGHRNGLKAELTVLDNLSFWRALASAQSRDAGLPVEAALDAVGLAALAHLPAGVLSAGQSRRAALARLLVAHRPIWLLDEPTAALDAASDAMVAALILAHVRAGGLAVAATHQPLDLPGALRLAMPARPDLLDNARDGELDDGFWLDARHGAGDRPRRDAR
ncbi:heme ABC exporter, ATP-binding protein CcmA [Rhizobium rhizosphaerae]|uniref:Heme ABC exporter, ATP-binding protein CcmA n=1 Tax=Xaviernesmea rhizosphaerae TaxID=1672749 RepID=A0ABX3PFJ2_9HYPH|nr:heme ABC exporter ATP-binding protein CcmA [Xaviernesmea rhizosphaerae]OQP86886.1 heme ABC exporter, ATP-binding protein CcmA [Xaviernesmea rhizosphaerae]